MKERAWELMTYGPILLALILLAEGTLILVGPLTGGPLGVIHDTLRDVYADDDRVAVDPVQPAILVDTLPPSSLLQLPADGETAAGIPAGPSSPLALATSTSCAALRFEASVGINEEGYVSFGRFNMVSDTDPHGHADPLTQWKLLQFGGFPIRMDAVDAEPATTIPVNHTVNLLISDPYTQDMLLSAKWEIKAIEVRGRYASINAALERNLSGVGTNNTIDSPTLESFSRDGRAALTMGFAHTGDIAPALKAGEPVYAAVTGTLYPAFCLE
jgi:hypothetical protein